MSVLDPRELEASPLADLHALASELGIEGYRRFRKEELIRQIVSGQGGEAAAEAPPSAEETVEAEEEKPKPRRRGLRGRARKEEPEAEAAEEPMPPAAEEPMPPAAEDEDTFEGEDAGEDEEAAPAPEAAEEVRGGILDVLPNGSGFLRADPFRQSREDIYVSPAQIRRCELRSGDDVSGPVRPPRRNERHPSLVRVDTVNGGPAEPPADRPRFDELKAVYPTKMLPMPPALASVPFGMGSRVAIGGPPGAGASQLLRELAKRLKDAGIEVTVVLAGVRPEEVGDWTELGVTVAGGSFDAAPEEQAQVADLAVQRGRRAAEAGLDAAVVIDSLDALPQNVARRVFGAGRNAEGAGTLTIVASSGTGAEPHRMATTRIVLEPFEGGAPRVAAAQSGTLRADLLGA